jgi:5-methylcytosine-specific restriction endonuclease McrA
MRRLTAFHSSRAWKNARQLAKRAVGYRCQRCDRFLPGKGELHCHHRKPVAGNPGVALEPLNYRVLCPACHNIEEPRTGERHIKSGCDVTGQPLSPSHPWNVRP